MTKWVYDPSTKKAHHECQCTAPCSPFKCSRMVYIEQQSDYRAYPETVRGTQDWDDTYKVKMYMERFIQHVKDRFCLVGRRT